jgi:hypothetical protein
MLNNNSTHTIRLVSLVKSMTLAFSYQNEWQKERFFIDFKQMVIFKLKISVLPEVSNISNLVAKCSNLSIAVKHLMLNIFKPMMGG